MGNSLGKKRENNGLGSYNMMNSIDNYDHLTSDQAANQKQRNSAGSSSSENYNHEKKKKKKPNNALSGQIAHATQYERLNQYETNQQQLDRVRMIEESQKWQTSFSMNIFTQSLAFWTSLPITWFIISAQLSYPDAIRSLSWIVSIYALGDGLGLYLAQKLYGNLSARHTLNLSIIFSMIASLIYALAGLTAAQPESSSSIFRQLVTARVIQGICHGTTYLTQQAYVGQVLPKDKNNALQLKMGRSYMIAIPFAVLLAFVSSLCHCMLGEV